MLTSTFIHVPGVGYATERKIWEMGICDWQQYVSTHNSIRLPESKKSLILPVIEKSISALDQRDDTFFARSLPAIDHWRALSHFGRKGQIAYIDIETTGCYSNSDITVIGYYDGYEMKSFVEGINMNDFPSAIASATMLVTFFGTGFDLPYIRRRFPQLKLGQPHIDLCYLLRRLGFRGGLKHIEQCLCIRRTDETNGLDGMDAIRLWNEYRNGSREALQILLQYNKEDVLNMEVLLDFACRKMQEILKPQYNI